MKSWFRDIDSLVNNAKTTLDIIKARNNFLRISKLF